MEGQRDGGTEGWKDRVMEGQRDGRMKGQEWRDRRKRVSRVVKCPLRPNITQGVISDWSPLVNLPHSSGNIPQTPNNKKNIPVRYRET